MLLPRFVVGTLSVGMTVVGTGLVSGQQNYPNKPIRIVISETGGGLDFTSRLIAPAIAGSLGQSIIIENRGGPSGIIPITTVAKASPDGYTLLLYTSTMWLSPLLRDHVPYDPVRDFSPITLTSRAPNILVVSPSVPAKSVKELIAVAKARPGELNYASSGTGGSTHLATELFKSMAGVNIVQVNYKGGGPATSALLNAEVQLMFVPTPTVGPFVKAGRLRALAVTSAEASALAPGLPTVAASGLPGYEAVLQFGMFAPAKTPATLINRLNQEVVVVLNSADVKEKLFNSGVEVVASSPEEFAAAMKSEMARMGKVIKDAGIRAN